MEFMRNFNDWKIDRVASFCHLLESYIPIDEGNDRMRWKLKSNRDLTMHSLSETLRGSTPMPFS